MKNAPRIGRSAAPAAEARVDYCYPTADFLFGGKRHQGSGSSE
jgi:hypothetical protein